MDNFYVTLRSDDSLELYPQNSPTKFSNKLPYPLDFTNEYEVAASSLFLDLPVREMTVSAYAVRLNLEGKGIRNPKESFAIQQFTLTADDIVLDLLNKIEDVIDRLYHDTLLHYDQSSYMMRITITLRLNVQQVRKKIYSMPSFYPK